MGFVLLVLTILVKIAVLPKLYRFLFITSGLLFYLGISGGAISVMRAVSMAILYTYGNFREKEILPWSIVGFAAFIFLLIDPSQLFSLSFQLSFGAVGGILFMLAQFRKLTENNEWLQSLRRHTSFRWLMDALVVSFGAQLGTFLPIALIFGENTRMGICCESGNYSSGRIGSGYRFDHFTHTSNYNSFGRHLWPSFLGRIISHE